jgi:hypothetical protein
MTAARLFLRRVKWKRPPSNSEIWDAVLATIWGPTLFASDDEWFFAGRNGHSDPNPPAGTRQVSHHDPVETTALQRPHDPAAGARGNRHERLHGWEEGARVPRPAFQETGERARIREAIGKIEIPKGGLPPDRLGAWVLALNMAIEVVEKGEPHD